MEKQEKDLGGIPIENYGLFGISSYMPSLTFSPLLATQLFLVPLTMLKVGSTQEQKNYFNVIEAFHLQNKR
jgi:hypothetical protein